MTTQTMEMPTIVLRKYEGRYLTGVIVHTQEQKEWVLSQAKFPNFRRDLTTPHNGGQIYFFDTQKDAK